jgi:hypothetical protein
MGKFVGHTSMRDIHSTEKKKDTDERSFGKYFKKNLTRLDRDAIDRVCCLVHENAMIHRHANR